MAQLKCPVLLTMILLGSSKEIGDFDQKNTMHNFRTSQRPDIVDRLPLQKIAPVVWQLPLFVTNVKKEIRSH